VMDPVTRQLNLDSEAITENTRAAYPIDFIENHVPAGRGGHPANIVFLSADAFGVLPPISKLTPEQAMYYFLSGYTAKLAGTERGVTEPQATFSTCFGSVFLAHHPTVYADMLGKLIAEHNAHVWLEHRLERRPVRRGRAHEDRPHARHDQRPAWRRACHGAHHA